MTNKICISFALTLSLIAGCSSSSGPKLAPADGTVTFKGQPLVGATVMLVPEKGPFAMGVTGKDGKFTVATAGRPGVIVASVKVSITAGSASSETTTKQPMSPAEAEEYMKKAAETQAAIASGRVAAVQSVGTIPEKYSKAETSGLTYTIQENGDNHFKIDLVE